MGALLGALIEGLVGALAGMGWVGFAIGLVLLVGFAYLVTQIFIW